MAEHGSDYTRGEMIIEEHEATFNGFIKLSKWGSLYIAALLLLLTMWFCTTAGFLAGVVCAALLVVVGTLVLSEKHKL
jgi:ABC-type enterochelin transport system permease subunit